MALNPTQYKQAEYVRDVMAIRLEPGESLDVVKSPAYWSHVANRMKAGSKIEVYASDNAFYAELLVTSVSKAAAQVAILSFVDVTTAEGTEPDRPVSAEPKTDEGGAPYYRRWEAKKQVHEVVRRADATVVFSDADRKKAEAALQDYLLG